MKRDYFWTSSPLILIDLRFINITINLFNNLIWLRQNGKNFAWWFKMIKKFHEIRITLLEKNICIQFLFIFINYFQLSFGYYYVTFGYPLYFHQWTFETIVQWGRWLFCCRCQRKRNNLKNMNKIANLFPFIVCINQEIFYFRIKIL